MVVDMHGHWLSPGLREWGFSLVSLRNASANAKPLNGIEVGEKVGGLQVKVDKGTRLVKCIAISDRCN